MRFHAAVQRAGKALAGLPGSGAGRAWFSCNQFGKQEPGDEGAISGFCELNYGVSFPLFKKIDVNGDQAHPLFVQLKKQAPGLLGSERIKWNFTKFLIGKDGKLVKRFAPLTKPEELTGEIEALLR